MKSQNGVTLTSLVIYITIVLIVVGILAVITASFQSNVREIYAEGTNNAEVDKFNVYFLKEVKKQGNEINTISESEVLFTTGNKYTFNSGDKCIYLNDNIKIAEKIEKCEFVSALVNEKTVITVTIKAVIGEEKTLEYVLGNETLVGIYDEESDYTNYIPKDWDLSKLNSETPIYVEVINNEMYIAPIPKGFEISTKQGENTISGGLVITDENENEFVWVPITTDFESTYNKVSSSDGGTFSEPVELQKNETNSGYPIDSQNNLDYYYGKNYYDFNADFDYETHYAEMVTSVNKYNGFYIGRYETTIETATDGTSTIGSKTGTTVLTIDKLLKEGTNTGTGLSGEKFYYRWWGLYDSQRKADVEGNGDYIQTNMIWGQQWDAMLAFLGTTQADSTIQGTQTGVLKSAEAVYGNNEKDVMNNIYDLRRNVYERTAEAFDTYTRVMRGRTL